jgi:hypothetical protein
MEFVYGDMHDCCARHHRRPHLPNRVVDLAGHLHLNRPWQYKLVDRGYESAVTAAVEGNSAQEHTKAAA